jgi:hypothetical protein
MEPPESEVTASGELEGQLLPLAWEQEKYFLEEVHRRLVFFGSLLPALLGATVAGVLSATEWFHFLAIGVGPLVILMVGRAARDAMKRSSRRFLEAVTLRAKCEHALGMTNPRPGPGRSTWVETESFVCGRHLRGRLSLQSALAVKWSRTIWVPRVVGAGRLTISREGPEVEKEGAEFKSSDDFVEAHLREGVQATYERLFRAVDWLAWGLLLLVSVKAVLGLLGAS